MLVEGKKAPAFTLPSSEGGNAKLSSYAGKYVVVYFYPKDDTPGCTTEAKDFEAARATLEELGAVVLGVSKDSLERHAKFKTKHGLAFPLLTDESGEVIEKYGAWGEKNMYGKKSMGIIRTTVIVGPDGKVVKVFPKVRVAGHVEKVVEAIRAHQDA
ncbi:MAG: peroxiredoxin [Myxococcales bacterium]|nr:peroxiredoxin [Myxococcales bacterium]